MRLDRYDRVLWDFNGTLYDDLMLGINSINTLLARYDLPPLDSVELYRDIFRFPVRDYYEDVGLPVDGEGFHKVAHEWLELYRAGEHTVTLRVGAEKALAYLRDRGMPQGVLSATEMSMLHEQIAAVGITEYLDCVLGRGDIYAADKSSIAAAYAVSHPNERVLMVGDTIHDFETARAGGFDCVLLEGGHQSRRVLLGCGCPVLADFDALIAYLEADE